MTNAKHSVVSILIAAGALIASVVPAAPQGCVLLRPSSPLFGVTGPLEQQAGTWTLTFTARGSTADIHYSGTVRQVQRETEGTYVVNRQHSVTANVGYQLTPRLSLNAGIPFIEASWGIPSPRSAGPSARANENARGLGDVTALARVALAAPAPYRTWNVLVGGGVKIPTGNHEATDRFPDGNGANNVERYVDISVQPGDGGWGILFDAQGYKAFGRFTAFGSGTWLANPKDTAGPTRGTIAASATPANFNTVSDQFIVRAGTTATITPRVELSIAWRMEGVPRYDLIGRSDGFRRPGVEMYWEPGVTINAGRHTMALNIPVGYYFNRFPNPYTGNRGDATFPEYLAIATYSVRLGRTHAAMPAPTSDQPPRSPIPGN